MTCVLSMPALNINPISEGSTYKQSKGYESFDFNGTNAQYPHSGLSENQRCSSMYHVQTSTGSSVSCRMGITCGLSECVKQELFNLHTEEGYETDLKEKHVTANGTNCVTSLSEICNNTRVEQGYMHGVKRKAEDTQSEEVYIPSKRISPFLNTPKKRKYERKKLLKISLKKLKQLDDPEVFLRKTVLVNNLTRSLQSEIPQEKLRTKKCTPKKRKPFNEYDVPNNTCMSGAYLFDDPFLSDVHEQITDDMTDTFINNVLRETNDKTNESETCEKSDFKFNEMEVTDEQPRTYSRTLTSFNVTEGTAN